MCYVAAIPYIITAVAAVGAGYISYRGSQISQDYNAKIADSNKKTLEAQAQDAERQGQIQAQENRLKTRMRIATQQVGFGAQNVEQTGTALDILGDTAMFGQIDEDRIAANAARKAFGFRFQGYNVEAQKRLNAFQGKTERMGTVLTTIGSVASAGYGAYSAAPAAGAGTMSLSQTSIAQNPTAYDFSGTGWGG